MSRKPFNERPHFILNKRAITAGGILIIDYKNERCLLQYNSNKDRWDDFGGKAEFEDDTIIHTMIRELYEESNKLIGDETNKINLSNAEFFYIKQAKYILAVLDSKSIKIDDDLTKYGSLEVHTNIERYVKWVDCSEIINNKNNLNINPRLLHYFRNTCENATFFFDFFQKKKLYFYGDSNKELKQTKSDNFVLCQDLSFYKNSCLEFEEEKKQTDIKITKYLEMEKDYLKMKEENSKKKSLWKRFFG